LEKETARILKEKIVGQQIAEKISVNSSGALSRTDEYAWFIGPARDRKPERSQTSVPVFLFIRAFPANLTP
jgi:hypothetical protein